MKMKSHIHLLNYIPCLNVLSGVDCVRFDYSGNVMYDYICTLKYPQFH